MIVGTTVTTDVQEPAQVERDLRTRCLKVWMDPRIDWPQGACETRLSREDLTRRQLAIPNGNQLDWGNFEGKIVFPSLPFVSASSFYLVSEVSLVTYSRSEFGPT